MIFINDKVLITGSDLVINEYVIELTEVSNGRFNAKTE